LHHEGVATGQEASDGFFLTGAQRGEPQLFTPNAFDVG
jgi:hypothetical protein